MTCLSKFGSKAKILAAVLPMACVAVAGSFYADAAMTSIDRSYSALLAQEEVVALQAARFSQLVNSHGYIVYKLMEAKNTVTATADEDYGRIQTRTRAEYDDVKGLATTAMLR